MSNNAEIQMKNLLWVTSGPSGAGKTTLLNKLMNESSSCVFSVSATTRSIRSGEMNEKDYFFISEAEFLQMAGRGEFLEWAKVHNNYYGTPKKFIEQKLNEKFDVILDIDVQGGLQVKNLHLPEAVMVFIAPPSIQDLEKRLRERGTETEEIIQRRLNNASWELTKISEYEYLVINDRLEEAVSHLKAIMLAEKLKVKYYPELKF